MYFWFLGFGFSVYWVLGRWSEAILGFWRWGSLYELEHKIINLGKTLHGISALESSLLLLEGGGKKVHIFYWFIAECSVILARNNASSIFQADRFEERDDITSILLL